MRQAGIDSEEVKLRYVDALWALPALQAWVADAHAAGDFIADDEPYRTTR